MPTLAPDTGSFALFTEVPDQEKKKKKKKQSLYMWYYVLLP